MPSTVLAQSMLEIILSVRITSLQPLFPLIVLPYRGGELGPEPAGLLAVGEGTAGLTVITGLCRVSQAESSASCPAGPPLARPVTCRADSYSSAGEKLERLARSLLRGSSSSGERSGEAAGILRAAGWVRS